VISVKPGREPDKPLIPAISRGARLALLSGCLRERAEEVRDGRERGARIGEVLFRFGPGRVQAAADVPLARDRDEQMIRLDLDPHDAYT
jgi:hypothetical protein